MSDIFREVDEDLRRDRLVEIWRRFGALIVAGAVLIVVATAGTVAWRRWQANKAEAQTSQLAQAIQSGSESDGAKKAAQTLGNLVASSEAGRALIGRFYEAQMLAKGGDAAGAARIYDQIAANGDTGQSYRDLAALLSVEQQLAKGEPAALRARLKPLLEPGNPWRFSAQELDALLAVRAGDRAGAVKQFRKLADEADAPQGLRSRASDLAAAFTTESK